MSAALAVQEAIRARLVASPDVVDLVPAIGIIDRNARPTPFPSIILGEDQETDEGDIDRRNVRVFSTLHVWHREPGLAASKAVAGAIRRSIASARLAPAGGFAFVDCRVSSSRFIRDPDGDLSHGIVTIETLAREDRT